MRLSGLARPLAVLLLAALSCRGERPAIDLMPERLPEARAGEPYAVTVLVVGNRTPVGNLALSQGELPAGLTLVHERGRSDAEIRGTPTKAGDHPFELTAYCLGTNEHGQEARRKYVLSVK